MPTYSLCLDKTKQSHTKSRQNNLHSVHARPCRIYEQSVPKSSTSCHQIAVFLRNTKIINSNYNINNNSIIILFTQHPYCCVNNIVLTLFLNSAKFDVHIHSLNLIQLHGVA